VKNIYIITTEDPLYSKDIIEEIYSEFPNNIKGVGLSGGLFTLKRVFLSPLIYGFFNYFLFGYKVIKGVFFGGKIKNFCISKNIPIDNLPSVNDGNLYNILLDSKIDLLLLINCSKKLYQKEFNLPKHGTINIHFGELPKYRGLMTILHSMRYKEKKNGITIHYVNERLDSGNIIDQEYVEISKRDDLLSVWKKSSDVGRKMLTKLIKNISEGHEIKTKANKDELSNYFKFPSLQQILHYRWIVFKNRYLTYDS
tara:strand:+ start:676 stop:1437 length:762 start_codon:yes stop_codon:yes gene_type:complete